MGMKSTAKATLFFSLFIFSAIFFGLAQAENGVHGLDPNGQQGELKRVLSLQDCLGLAQERNPEMQVLSLVEKMAQEDVKTATGAFMPTVVGFGSYTRIDDTAALPVVPGSLLFTEVGAQNNFLFGATAVQPVYDHTLIANRKVAKRQEDVARYQREKTDKTATAGIKKAFYRALFFKDIASFQKDFRSSTSQELTRVKGRHKRGTASGLELARAEGIEASTRTSYEDTLANYERAKDDLKRLIGYPIDYEIILEGTLGDYTRSERGSPPVAEGEDSGVRLAEAQYQLARAATGQKLSQFYPKIYGHFNLYVMKPNFLIEPDTDFTFHWWGGGAITIPVFDGLRTLHQYHKAKAQEKIAFILKEEAEKNSQIQERYEKRHPPEPGTQLEGPRKTFEAAQKAYRVAEVAHRNRLISYPRWVQAQRAWGNARVKYAQAQLKYLSEQADQN